ncbi:M55 family metallopeptidase [Kosmotoga pacifica]|uniref:M55 family metallopeptidase n=1 Tax=Kosmotoga pacifica TaxID=1330330 RepID=UPI00069B4E43|nr:M55 family metallopeptidase [Kosmotoga pacifica]
MNDIGVNETFINTAYTGSMGIPIGLIYGDSGLRLELLKEPLCGYFYKCIFVESKEFIERYSAVLPSFKRIEENILLSVKRLSTVDIKEFTIVRLGKSYTIEMELVNTAAANTLKLMPGVMKSSGRRVNEQFNDFKKLMNFIIAAVYL